MIILRRIKSNDYQQILNWRNSPNVSKFMYNDHTITETEHTQWFEKAINKENGHHWIIVYSGTDIGLASITHIDEVNMRCSTGFYIVDEKLYGKGIGALVKYKLLEWSFINLQIQKVYSEHFSFNKPIIKLNEKFGYKKEGLFRKHALKDGELQDVVYMGILQEEWQERREVMLTYLKNKGILKG